METENKWYNADPMYMSTDLKKLDNALFESRDRVGSAIRFNRWRSPMNDILGPHSFGALMYGLSNGYISNFDTGHLPKYGEPFLWNSKLELSSSKSTPEHIFANRFKFFIGSFQTLFPEFNFLKPGVPWPYEAELYQPPYFVGPYYTDDNSGLISIVNNPYASNVGYVSSSIKSIGDGLTLENGVLSATAQGDSSELNYHNVLSSTTPQEYALGGVVRTLTADGTLTDIYGSQEISYSASRKWLLINGDAIIASDTDNSRISLNRSYSLLGNSTSQSILDSSLLHSEVSSLTLTNPTQNIKYCPVVWDSTHTKLAVKIGTYLTAVKPTLSESIKTKNTTTDDGIETTLEVASDAMILNETETIDLFKDSIQLQDCIKYAYSSYIICDIGDEFVSTMGTSARLTFNLGSAATRNYKKELYVLFRNTSSRSDIDISFNESSRAINIWPNGNQTVTIPAGQCVEISAIVSGVSDVIIVWTYSTALQQV